ncbi:N-acetyltransferase [Sphingosinicella sp. LHD-64]|uniref:GNAT family N-acetyltransferase n=1 Tax=Sphingosinicella sp. LHD-64 TaxID=3072139 RepID=UPI0028104130|nr:N-acetyltransferase [Sphingosinicella sp. LHD-64]MDQ8758273.1 N-acetyltransferase [Sphingosinicella sp. LHD-64]
MTITYRDATEADAAIMADLGGRSFTETFGHLYTPDNLAAFLEKHSEASWRGELGDPRIAVRLAEGGGATVGFAKIGPPGLPIETTPQAIELFQFYVLEPWQGAGIAPVLMDWVLTAARDRSAADIYLSVFTENIRAQRFYARYGFTEVARHAFMVGTHADEDIIMRRTL